MSKAVVTIEDWAVVQSAACPTFEKLEPGMRLLGNISGHPNLSSERFTYTSSIVSVDITRRMVETRNTVYQLGRSNASYQAWEEFEHALGVPA
jgi:hypothetical protein